MIYVLYKFWYLYLSSIKTMPFTTFEKCFVSLPAKHGRHLHHFISCGDFHIEGPELFIIDLGRSGGIQSYLYLAPGKNLDP